MRDKTNSPESCRKNLRSPRCALQPPPHSFTGAHRSAFLKSTSSTFKNFYSDEFTTLVAVNNRIVTTSIDLMYTFRNIALPPTPTRRSLTLLCPLHKGADGYEGSIWTSMPLRVHAPRRSRPLLLMRAQLSRWACHCPVG